MRRRRHLGSAMVARRSAVEQLCGEWNICASGALGKQTFCSPCSTWSAFGSKQLATRCVRAKCRTGLRQASCPSCLFPSLARCKSFVKKVDVIRRANVRRIRGEQFGSHATSRKCRATIAYLNLRRHRQKRKDPAAKVEFLCSPVHQPSAHRLPCLWRSVVVWSVRHSRRIHGWSLHKIDDPGRPG